MDSFHQLQQEYQHCQRCPALCKSRKQVVFGSGNPRAEILLIGEAPGFNEDQQGIPFCGESGKVLQELLTSIGLTRNEVFITNTILCRPENNRNPLPEEVENCRERLDTLIEIMQPKVIVTIGNFATQRILVSGGRGVKMGVGTGVGKEIGTGAGVGIKTGITAVRGKVFSTVVKGQERPGGPGESEIKVIPVIHPANYLYQGRNPAILEQMKKDFQEVKMVIDKIVNEKNEQVTLGNYEK
ncbi:MAG: uracil-DNA glycosylase [Nanoarchaeota archaeon]